MFADLSNAAALVTGGASGIGRGISGVLAARGAAVAVCDLDEAGAARAAAEIEAGGGRAVAAAADVTDRASIAAAAERAIAELGRVDILVNNAGVVGAPGWAEREGVTQDDWDLALGVNLRGTVNATEALEAHMTGRGSGSIVNIASIAGRLGNPDRPAYNASKAAVISYTRSAALRLAPSGVTVNCVCPGMIWTPMWERIASRQFEHGSHVFARDAGESGPRALFDRLIEATTPLGRPQTPEDVGNAVAFLCSEQARNITGQSLNVDGGRVMS